VPTVQLKWLLRAQQDYEYLYLARQRGQTVNAIVMSRLLTKPVEIQPNQVTDPTYALMVGTTDPSIWSSAFELLVRNILLNEPGQTPRPNDVSALDLAMSRWTIPQERPVLMARTTQWTRDTLTPGNAAGAGNGGGAFAAGDWISLRLGVDIYNASDNRPDQNTLQWTAAYDGFQLSPRPSPLAALATYNVRRFNLEARVDPTKVKHANRIPHEITFTNGYNGQRSAIQVVLPAGVSDRREGGLVIDGSLGDWSEEDAIQNGPMVQMFDRPTVQAGLIRQASTPTSLFTGWADENFYLAFRVSGIAGGERGARNFVNYQFRRAWGEDLEQLIVQPVYADNTAGPVLHVVVKPNGSVWTERKGDARLLADPWQPFEGAGLRFAGTLDGDLWRGELAIPWSAITESGKPRPTLLRMNFAQHIGRTGETASWAGPVDFGRDDSFTGVLLVRDPETPGMR
jgi:hypothetical protein